MDPEPKIMLALCEIVICLLAMAWIIYPFVAVVLHIRNENRWLKSLRELHDESESDQC